MMTLEQLGLVGLRTPLFDFLLLSSCTDADHMTTLNPRVPTTLPVLYADEYGERHFFQ